MTRVRKKSWCAPRARRRRCRSPRHRLRTSRRQEAPRPAPRTCCSASSRRTPSSPRLKWRWRSRRRWSTRRNALTRGSKVRLTKRTAASRTRNTSRRRKRLRSRFVARKVCARLSRVHQGNPRGHRWAPKRRRCREPHRWLRHLLEHPPRESFALEVPTCLAREYAIRFRRAWCRYRRSPRPARRRRRRSCHPVRRPGKRRSVRVCPQRTMSRWRLRTRRPGRWRRDDDAFPSPRRLTTHPRTRIRRLGTCRYPKPPSANRRRFSPKTSPWSPRSPRTRRG
mmetsp:Transcript_5767/g.21801  ORF Transcript_5767/g.21801 Transcript_5767/m.21801 type:complete len:281 (-) Transcript_5767:1429-2271(-)